MSEEPNLVNQEADKGRFSVQEDGHVLWQKDSTNPLPGTIIAAMGKGDDLYSPRFSVIDGTSFPRPETLEQEVKAWFTTYLDEVLGGILRFASADGLPEHVRGIARALKDHGGVVQRHVVEKELAQLDPDQRKIIRQHRIRLGPLLIFFSDLLKPNALKLKALLWGVYNDMDLPVARPKDGLVSQVLDNESVDHAFYRMLGYPVFGGRAIRIDMLDRVVTDIYDSSKEGQFRAQHKYAEWLGCSIDALYTVLEALGHRKVEDAAPTSEGASDVAAEDTSAQSAETPAESDSASVGEAAAPEAVAEAVAEAVTEETVTAAETPEVPVGAPVAATVEIAAESAEPVGTAETTPVAKPEVEKPELALFRLKKGKLSERSGGGRKPHGKSFGGNKFTKKPVTGDAAAAEGDAANAEKQPYKKGGYKGDRSKDGDGEGGYKGNKSGKSAKTGSGSKNARFGDDAQGGDRKKRFDKKHVKNEDRGPRIITIEAKKKDEDDSPFAILKNLKF